MRHDGRVTAPPSGSLEALRARWLAVTKQELPARARQERWPLRNDHCFQRVVLDAVCGGRWYDHVERPAYRNLDAARLTEAVTLAERLVTDPAGESLLRELNAQSLAWRGKQRPRQSPPY